MSNTTAATIQLQPSRRIRIHQDTDSGLMLSFAAELASRLDSMRKRKYSGTQLAACTRHMKIVLLDLLAATETSPDLWIGYSRGKPNFVKGGVYWNEERGEPYITSTYFLDVINFLANIGLIESHIAHQGLTRFSSRMKATTALAAEFRQRQLNWTSIRTAFDAPAIVVKGEDKRPTTWPGPGGFPLEQAIANLRRLNDNLSSTLVNLNISDDDLMSINSSRAGNLDEESAEFGEQKEPIDFSRRQLRRIFSLNSFSTGGRFYGGWWQGVPSRFRKFIEIDNAITIELDYSTLQPRILYASVGLEPPADSYMIPGWDPDLRRVTKKLFSQLINSDETSRNPNQWHRFAPDIEPGNIPVNWDELGAHEKNIVRRIDFRNRTQRDYNELIQDLLVFHQPIVQDFFSKAWGATQNLDSQIAEKVMLKLLDEEVPITALPIHDSFIVRRGGEEPLRQAMIEAFNEVVQTGAKIDRDETVFDTTEDHEGLGVVVADEDLHELTTAHLETHKGYHIRGHQWEQTWGPF